MNHRLVLVLALISLTLLARSTAAQAPQKLVFALNWFAVGDHAAYWVALDKGYYKARGLEVELQNSKGSADSIAKVDTGRADLGLADAVVVIPRIAQGAKIKIVGAVFDNTPLNIWTRKDTGITKPKDLEGKLLAAPPGDSQRQLFPAFAKVNGLDASKVKWLTIEPAAKFVALAEKRADAVPDYTTGQPFWEKAVGKDNLVRMPWHQYGFDTYSMSIMTADKTLAERSQTVRDFLAASYMGWRDVMDNPKAALEIFKKRVPDIDLALIEPNMMLGLELMRTERYARNGIGWMDRGKMCGTVEFINTYMPDMPRKVACDEVFTNELLTKIEPPKEVIVLDRVGMTYRAESGPVEALLDISFTVGRGELVVLVGPSGCGKSTLLRIVAGLRPPTVGSVTVDGRTVRGPIAAVGMVFQAPVLLKWRTVRDNVLLAAELSGLDPRRYRARAEGLLALVGLADFASKYPRELSGGMQQRASICRALLLDPPLLLMDEPFGALDALTRDDMNLELLRVWGESGPERKTIVFVTHSIPEAVFLADKVVVVSPRPGRVTEIFAVPLPRPRTPATRALPDFGRIALGIHETLARPPER